MKHPPGRKVYQRGAHTIWEVDGAKEKVCTSDWDLSIRCLLHSSIRLDVVVLPESVTFR